MSVTIVKTLVGKEDFSIQTNLNAAETFTRKVSTGGTINVTKIPDIWDGYGLITIGKCIVKASDDNGTVLHSFGGIT